MSISIQFSFFFNSPISGWFKFLDHTQTHTKLPHHKQVLSQGLPWTLGKALLSAINVVTILWQCVNTFPRGIMGSPVTSPCPSIHPSIPPLYPCRDMLDRRLYWGATCKLSVTANLTPLTGFIQPTPLPSLIRLRCPSGSQSPGGDNRGHQHVCTTDKCVHEETWVLSVANGRFIFTRHYNFLILNHNTQNQILSVSRFSTTVLNYGKFH